MTDDSIAQEAHMANQGDPDYISSRDPDPLAQASDAELDAAVTRLRRVALSIRTMKVASIEAHELDGFAALITALRSQLAQAAKVGSEGRTPAAHWREKGEPDPHGDRFDCERAALPKGHLTDDEIANGIYMADRSSLDLIVWQEAAKQRIRWLSRKLCEVR